MLQVRKNFVLLILSMMLGALLLACGAETPTETVQPTPAAGEKVTTPTLPAPPNEDTIAGEAAIEELQVNVRSTTPVQVEVVARGSLPDGCTETAEIQQTRADNTFMITIVTQRPTDLNCTQQIVRFEETFMLENVEGLEENIYTVMANGATAQFELELSSLPGEESQLTASVSPASGPVGTNVQLTAAGFPANTAVDIGFGPVDSEYSVIGNAQTDDAGQLATNVVVPANATTGEWAFVVVSNGQDAVTNPFTVTVSTTPTTASNQPNQAYYMYLVALEDGGQSGELIGCNDSIVPVEITFAPTIAPLTAALNHMFSLSEQMYGQSGLYNVFYNSNVSVAGINIVNRQATINITGDLTIGGVCDEPRIEAQIRATALQFSTIDAVVILYDGVPLNEHFSGQG